MLGTDKSLEIMADARALQQEAVRLLEQGDIRDAAEKAWCATLRATNALILARTGEEPQRTPATARMLDDLTFEDARVRSLVGRYYSRQTSLHGDCFYLGLPPTRHTERRIRETADFIRDAGTLAGIEGNSG